MYLECLKKWTNVSARKIALLLLFLSISLFTLTACDLSRPTLPTDASQLLTQKEAGQILGKPLVKTGSRSWFGDMIKFEYESTDATSSVFVYAEVEKGGWPAAEKHFRQQGKQYVSLEGVGEKAVYLDESNTHQQQVTIYALKNSKFVYAITTSKEKVNCLELTRKMINTVLSRF